MAAVYWAFEGSFRWSQPAEVLYTFVKVIAERGDYYFWTPFLSYKNSNCRPLPTLFSFYFHTTSLSMSLTTSNTTLAVAISNTAQDKYKATTSAYKLNKLDVLFCLRSRGIGNCHFPFVLSSVDVYLNGSGHASPPIGYSSGRCHGACYWIQTLIGLPPNTRLWPGSFPIGRRTFSRDHHLGKEVPQTPEAARYGVVVRLITPTSSKLAWLVPVWECFPGHLFRTAQDLYEFNIADCAASQ